MAVLQRVETTCDRCEPGTHDADTKIETVPFGLEGVDYEIDLCGDEATKLRDELGRHAQAGRRKHKTITSTTPSQPRGEATKKAKQQREYLAAVRNWARDNGFEVSDKGRVAENIIAAYEKAHAQPEQHTEHQAAAGQQPVEYQHVDHPQAAEHMPMFSGA